MALYKFTVSIEAASELPEDVIVNTWHFEGSGSDFANVGDMLDDFYSVTPTGAAFSVSSCFPDDSVSGNFTIRAYNMDEPEPRPPVYESSRVFPSLSSGDALPTEVALVMSYHAQLVAGVPAARLRGRVYLGPFSESVNTAGMPSTGLMPVIAAAGRDLIQASNASVSWDWVQHSPTTGNSSLVVGGWCDNAWDTQRRRGRATTSRTTFTGGTP